MFSQTKGLEETQVDREMDRVSGISGSFIPRIARVNSSATFEDSVSAICCIVISCNSCEQKKPHKQGSPREDQRGRSRYIPGTSPHCDAASKAFSWGEMTWLSTGKVEASHLIHCNPKAMTGRPDPNRETTGIILFSEPWSFVN